MPGVPTDEAAVPAATTSNALPSFPTKTAKPVTSGTKPNVSPAPSASTSVPEVTTAFARLTVASKYPTINYTPPTAVVTLTLTSAASAESQKGSYTVAYGDGTSGTFQHLGTKDGVQTWGANDHAYSVPGTYTVTAMHGKTMIAETIIVVTTTQIEAK